MGTGNRIVDRFHFVEGLSNTTPSTSTPRYVSLRDYDHLTVLISVKNATTVTGSAITLKQATAVAATGEKALAFTTYWRNIDTATSDIFAEATATSNTFTTDSTDSKNLLYVLEVDAADLDVQNNFDCVRVGTGNATAATLTVAYILSSNARGGRYVGVPANRASAIID